MQISISRRGPIATSAVGWIWPEVDNGHMSEMSNLTRLNCRVGSREALLAYRGQSHARLVRLGIVVSLNRDIRSLP